jgi:hypothetical protein
MFVRIFGLVMMVLTMLGIVWLLLQWSYEGDQREPWDHAPRIRTNFQQILTEEEKQERLKQKMADYYKAQGMEVPAAAANTPRPKANRDLPRAPFANEEPTPVPDTPSEGVLPSEEAKRDRLVDLELAKQQLTRERVFILEDEAQNLLNWEPLQDADRTRVAGEFAAHNGRQFEPYERLALQVLSNLPGAGYAENVHRGAYFWGQSQEAANLYRGYAFSVEGRLFDLWEVKPEAPIVLRDGTTIDRWFMGAVALLDKGIARNEHAFEHRVMQFMTVSLPENMIPYVGAADGVSHEDRLVAEPVMVKLTGAYLRQWAYERHVKPFESKARTEAHTPLLLTPDVAISDRPPYELTDELLQQVRDSLREDPRFLETEGAYYAILAKSNHPGDTIEPVPEIGYFDLAGAETGPRYRGQGVRVDGMIGDNYEPLILPPNISGLRRVFVAYVVDDTVNLESPKRYLVHMIDPPTGLEPRALVLFNARYYRNVFETDSTSSTVRPLLIVKRVRPYAEPDEGGNLFFAITAISGVLLIMVVLSWFVLSDRRERRAFEQQQMELSRQRLQKRGGLKLKPLPGKAKDAPADPPPPDES